MNKEVPSVQEVKNQANEVARQAAQAVHQAKPWVEPLARFGFAMKGVLYVTIGFLALLAAFKGGGKTTDGRGALVMIFHEPFGQFLLTLIAIGLAGYALWRLVDAVFNAENESQDAKGIGRRIGYLCSSFVYGGLAIGAFKLVAGITTKNSDNQTQDWTARLMSLPFGPFLVGAVGFIMIAVGIDQMRCSLKGDFGKNLNLNALQGHAREVATRLGKWGMTARGFVFAIIGLFLIQAALHANPKQAKGIGEALAVVAQQTFGQFLLAFIAAGFVAYGLFMWVEAKYHRIQI